MKLTQPRKVKDIVRPPIIGMPVEPAVGLSDPVMRAVELMVQYDRTAISVTVGGVPIGHVRLTEALQSLGLA